MGLGVQSFEIGSRERLNGFDAGGRAIKLARRIHPFSNPEWMSGVIALFCPIRQVNREDLVSSAVRFMQVSRP